ncbi:uncharacterized protein LOC135094639 [Scylla paramamosain]|uniref:uncharacterized protein LOC135094639 n=1 Tax=Scylla paramamosain TaxID=85552 RepID=UPI003083683D
MRGEGRWTLPVLTDLPDSSIVCHQLGTVGTSDHHAVLACVKLDIAKEAATPRTIWLWEQADWASLRHDIVRLDWDALLIGNIEEKARALTTKLLALQQQHVPSRRYLVRPSDPAWFGYRCRAAKHAAWVRYKRLPTHYNWAQHRVACRRVTATCRWARRQQREDKRRKLCGSGVGHKTWWRLVKDQQGTGHRDTVPPLTRLDGTTATSSEDKPSLLAEFFAEKMSVTDPGRHPPHLPQETDHTVANVQVTHGQVERLMREEARVVPAHKKNSKSEPSNCRPILLLSVVGKLLEQVVAGVICHHLSEHRLLSDRQFGFRSGRSTVDLLILLSQIWQDALDEGLSSTGFSVGPDPVEHIHRLPPAVNTDSACIRRRLQSLPLLLPLRQSASR